MPNEPIWAPWRLGYIMGDKKASEPTPATELLEGAVPDCFLCQDAVPGDDRGRLVIQRREHTFTVMNRYPYNNGHLLVAPKRHCARLDQLDPAEQLELSQTIADMVKVLEEVLSPEGFNVGLNLGHAAGAGLPDHLHWHLVPRWGGDTNFMPAVAGIRVIPQSLDALWEAMTEALASP